MSVMMPDAQIYHSFGEKNKSIQHVSYYPFDVKLYVGHACVTRIPAFHKIRTIKYDLSID